MSRENIANTLKTKRKTSGLSVEAVCDKLKKYDIQISTKTLYNYETAFRQPDADTLMALCDIYGITDILGAFGYKKEEPTLTPKDERDMMLWVENLKKTKSISGLTTKEIARQSGMPEPTLEKLFAGQTKDPKPTTMQQLVRFFGNTLDDLIAEENKNAPETAVAVSGDAKKVAIAYDKADHSVKFGVRKLLDIPEPSITFGLAARDGKGDTITISQEIMDAVKKERQRLRDANIQSDL